MANLERHFVLIVACVLILVAATAHGQDSIGIDYGQVANNLPQPDQVVRLLQSRSVKHVRIYNTDPTVLTAFANSGIDLGVTIPNENVASIANDPAEADRWVQSQIQPFSSTIFASIAVGNEYLAASKVDTSLDVSKLLPAMQNIRQSLLNVGLSSIQVSTPHSFDGLIAPPGFPPSSGAFAADLTDVMRSILDFLSQQNSVFMINVYPFFSYRDNQADIALDFALLDPNATLVVDSDTGTQYHNLFDAMVDTVISAMGKLGFGNLPVVITESGWASGPDGEVAATVQNAQTYNNNLVKHVLGPDGTPLRPGSGQIPTFIFALFNENLKVGNPVEQHFGLYNPDMTPVYDVQLTLMMIKSSLHQNYSSVIEVTEAPGVATRSEI